jgi:hypothetical protein
VGLSLEVIKVNLPKILEKIDLELMPFCGIGGDVVLLTAIVGTGCLILRDEGCTFPTMKLFARTTKLEKAGDVQTGTIHDWRLNWFDVDCVLRFEVLVGDLEGKDSSGFSGSQGSKVEGHLFNNFVPFFGGHQGA